MESALTTELTVSHDQLGTHLNYKLQHMQCLSLIIKNLLYENLSIIQCHKNCNYTDYIMLCSSLFTKMILLLSILSILGIIILWINKLSVHLCYTSHDREKIHKTHIIIMCVCIIYNIILLYTFNG